MNREPRHIDLDGTGGETAVSEPLVPACAPGVMDLSKEVRRIYIACYREFKDSPTYGRDPLPQWDGGEDAFGRRHKPIWGKIARVILENGAEPISFIRAQFWCRHNDTKPPAPNTLLSPEALARYRVFQQQAVPDARQEYETSLLTVQNEVLLLTSGLGWDYRRALRYALLNVVAVRASALFRFCLASTEGLNDVSENFWDQALLQYVFQKDAYDAAWTDKIPTQLRHEGDAVRQRILGRTSLR